MKKPSILALLIIFAGAWTALASDQIGSARDIYDGSLFPDQAVRTYANTDQIFPTRAIKASPISAPLALQTEQITSLSFTAAGKIYDLPDYVALNRMVGLLVLKDGKIAFEHYDFGIDRSTHWMSMSMAKSFVSTLVGAAIKDGFIGGVADPVTQYLPQLKGSAYDGVSIKDVLMMSSGVKWDETYVDAKSDRRKFLELQIASNKPGAIFDLLRTLPRVAQPGTRFNYNTGETVLIGEIVQSATKMHLADYLSQKIWQPIGMESDGRWWLDSPDGHEVGGSGILATLRDFGRFGQFILDGAKVGGQSIVPEWWLTDATSAKPIEGLGATNGYGYQWWTIKTETAGKIHEGAFMGRGIHGQYLYINPKHRVVIVGLAARSKPSGRAVIDDLDFLAAMTERLE